MRQHERYQRLAPAIDAGHFRELVADRHLVYARFEPGLGDRYEGLLDLVFAADGRYAIVPYVLVQNVMVLVRESSPLIWPAWLPPLRSATVDAIEAQLVPWLRARTLARVDGSEATRLFTADPVVAGEIARARSIGWLGAAPCAQTLRMLAPYVYAERFASGRRVAVVDPNGAYGAVVVARDAAEVRAELGDPELEALAGRWYGSDVFGRCDGWEAEVTIAPAFGTARWAVALEGGGRQVAVVEPLPPAITVSFDPADAPVVGSFGVVAPEPELRASALPPVPIVEGSQGRIAVVLRDDFAATPDADSDAGLALAERLRAQGFDARTLGVSQVELDGWDVLHVFGLGLAGPLSALVAQARARAIPIALTPYADDLADEAAWGAGIAQVALASGCDEAQRAYSMAAIAARNLTAATVPARGAVRLLANPDTSALLAAVVAVYPTCEPELRRLQEAGYRGFHRIVPALLGAEPEPEAIGPLVGADPYVLVHAAVEPRANQYALATAARRAGLPLVLLGSVRHAPYYAEVMGALGRRGCWLPEADLRPGELAALYAGARVYADASWSSGGLYRVARAAAFGAAVVAPSSGYGRACWPDLVREVDPGSIASIEAALRAAWDDAPNLCDERGARAGQSLTPLPLLAATLAGYQIKPGASAAEY